MLGDPLDDPQVMWVHQQIGPAGSEREYTCPSACPGTLG